MNQTIEKLVSLCKRRGIIFQSSEIYGGFGAVYDYGPLGIELKNNISQLWWKEMTQVHENIVGLDSAILMHPKIWEASGHVNAFHDPLVDCKQCNSRYRADEFGDDYDSIEWDTIKCPKCGTTGKMTEPRQFNLMFKTHVGPVEDSGAVTYLRPETAQGIYVNYQLVQGAMRMKIPFGIAQIGKAFRNEIVARNFIFRTREFEQMEMQYFVKPGTDDEFMKEWKEKRFRFYPNKLGVDESKIRFHEHGKTELAHYAKEAWDIEYEFPFGWSEIEGIHNRTDFDLSQHETFSGKKLQYFDQQENSRFLPYIIETSAGLNRMLLTVLSDAFWEDTENNRIVLKLHPRIAPVKAVICPLIKKEGLPEKARTIVDGLKPHFKVLYDQQGSIGKRYYRQDEAGTPFGITVDHQSMEDDSVTIRDRDTQEQTRISSDQILNFIRDKMD
ncbi:MAG: glycine--tRNA ligase [Candidatus Marinimicrobia bacterium]|mgnify:CR=1 FL=1|jgi:glycyl-tRNA synthetase|nr:glycine--tRNA ligase [Candidatus Neomarinimicrobiota bacterium]MBT3496547.1 glycine--tRNA ligase [Candidatus Neomarinimicrobiota bacterium]MBT3692348.1 glycine--tRNA ligase [Candidatus Neomarinimicrobiota bacterium]MBT4144909.1 glycine--tRNA ligase [Candidatus Neomarinimicrobiota bacterium]MBT4593778.1 glycine--tRNA ligase [Candidatus Neomarinimicrobiota bacterium]